MNPWEMNLATEGTTKPSSSAMPWEMELETEEVAKPALVETWQSNQPLGSTLEPGPFASAKPKEEPIMDLNAQRTVDAPNTPEPTQVSTEPLTTMQTISKGISENLTPNLVLDTATNFLKNVADRSNPEEYNIKQIGQDAKADINYAHKRWAHLVDDIGGFMDEGMRAESALTSNTIKGHLVKELQDRGVQAEVADGQIFIAMPDGSKVELTDSSIAREVLTDIVKNQYTIGSSIAGATAGYSLTPGSLPAKVAGATAGAAAGAYLGAGFDALINNIDLVNKLDAAQIHSKMVDEGVAAAILEPVGMVGAKLTVEAVKGLKNFYDFVLGGNREGAAQELKKNFNVDQTQIDEAIRNIEALQGPLPVSNQIDKGIMAVALTRPGGEAVISAAGVFNPSTPAVVGNQVFKRAEDVLKTTRELAADNTLPIVRQNLDAYTREVQDYYKVVKEAPAEFTKDYSFDFDKLGIMPIVDDIGTRIENPAIKQRFIDTLTRIEQASEGRGFTDLIDLRQAVNDIKFNTSRMKFSDKQALDSVIKTIDTEIDNAAKTHIPNSDGWMANWKKAKSEYASMKDLESNVLYKALTRPGISEETVIKTFTKYIAAGDDTFYNVMEKLPKNVQNRVEGSVLNNLTEKYTAGAIGTNRAVNFPQLSNELKKVSWSSPKAKQVVRTINRMAEVFKNDVNLARVSGRIEIPSFQSYLTTDPVARLKYEVASNVFNYAKMLVPGEQANTLALVKNTGKLLENPLDAKALKDIMGAKPKERREFRDKLNFEEELLNLRNMYFERQMALRQMYGKDAPPRLVWKSDPAKLAELQNPQGQVLPNTNQVLYGTQRGRVGTNPSEVTLSERADDLITEFIWANTKNAKNDDIVAKATEYVNDRRYQGIMQRVANKLAKDDIENNAKVVANSIRAEAGILIKRIEKDFGLKLPKEEAEKLVSIKFKEIMEKCNGQ